VQQKKRIDNQYRTLLLPLCRRTAALYTEMFAHSEKNGGDGDTDARKAFEKAASIDFFINQLHNYRIFH